MMTTNDPAAAADLSPSAACVTARVRHTRAPPPLPAPPTEEDDSASGLGKKR